MQISEPNSKRLLGSTLVLLQFGFLFFLGYLATPRILRDDIPLSALALAGTSLVLVLWTFRHNRLGNFNIRPDPKAMGVLVMSGPYQLIRHPMYTSVLLGAAALALLSEPLLAWGVWALLAGVLIVKATLEERWMHEQHPNYGAYIQRSKRFLPWLL
jgi:protein-S-isoprenylcysteine O-methyltransferase Ste14